MHAFLHWLKTRWRTRGDYGHSTGRLAWRLAAGLAVPVVLVAGVLGALWWVLGSPSRAGERASTRRAPIPRRRHERLLSARRVARGPTRRGGVAGTPPRRPAGFDPVPPRDTFVLAMLSGSIVRFELPAAVRPRSLSEAGHQGARFQSETVRILRWRGDALEIETEARGWISAPGATGSRSVFLRYTFDLGVDDVGVSEFSRDRVAYALSDG